MPLPVIRPLHVLWEENLRLGALGGVISGIRRVLKLAGVYSQIRVEYVGKRRQLDCLNPDGSPKPYQSLDWHIDLAKKNSKKRGHLNGLRFLDSLLGSPTYQTDPRYELVVVKYPLHWSDDSDRTVGGIGREGQGAIITVGKHLSLLRPVAGESEEENKKRRLRFELATQMLTMHELGHAFGLFPGTGKKNPTDKEEKAAHCLNECVMCWQENAELEERIKYQPFCPSCLEKLPQYFIAP